MIWLRGMFFKSFSENFTLDEYHDFYRTETVRHLIRKTFLRVANFELTLK